MMRWRAIRLTGFAALAALACIHPAASADNARPAADSRPTDIKITESSFRCIREMKRVRGFFIDNLLGNVEATEQAANSTDGAAYPPGSLVQVIPTSAMIKHQRGYNPETNDWEFFEMDVTAKGVTFLGRGFAELNMRNGLNCLGCHKPAKATRDLICDRARECTPIPLTPAMLRALQNTDPRCAKIPLPQEQLEALAALAARDTPAVPAK